MLIDRVGSYCKSFAVSISPDSQNPRWSSVWRHFWLSQLAVGEACVCYWHLVGGGQERAAGRIKKPWTITRPKYRSKLLAELLPWSNRDWGALNSWKLDHWPLLELCQYAICQCQNLYLIFTLLILCIGLSIQLWFIEHLLYTESAAWEGMAILGQILN